MTQKPPGTDRDAGGQARLLPGDTAPVRLTDDHLRLPIEQLVSGYRRRSWTVQAASDLAEFACHPSAILSDGSYSVFAKFSDAENGAEQFEIEQAGSRLLSQRAGVLTPMPIGILPVSGGAILVLEAVQSVARAPRHWRQIGQALAKIHAVKGESFGLDRDGYIGPLFQDNTPDGDWPTFYAQRRLAPGLRMAVDSGYVPPGLARQVEKVIARLPELSGPAVVPSLLHGDAQQNNFISTEQGAVVIDPAPYFGHPEVDLATLDSWQTVPHDVFDGYLDEMPIPPGFWDRRALWRVWLYLAAVTVEGPAHLDKLAAAVRPYA